MKIKNLIPGSRVAIVNIETLEVYFNEVAKGSTIRVKNISISYRDLKNIVVRVRNGKYPLVPMEYELADVILQENIRDF